MILFIAINIPNIRFGVSQTQNDLEGVNVRVYNGYDVLNSSYIALSEMFKWMNATVSSINSNDILSRSLIDCDILVFPGGGALSALLCIEIIRNFLWKGGSYFGICAGAAFGAAP